jgi:nucleotide-binding universal stress UspA family protein
MPEPASLPTTLVVGHSADENSQAALRVAADLAGRLHAHLHVVHGIDLDDYPVDPDSSDWDESARRNLAAQRAQVTDALADLPIAWTYHRSPGNPVALLHKIADAHHALMIIVGTRGEGLGAAASRVLDRSISHGVIAHQQRPVLVVPAER